MEKIIAIIALCINAVVIIALCLMTGCAGIATTETVCTVYQDVGATAENSIVASKITDPCKAQKILGTAATAYVLWQSAGNVALFHAWDDDMQALLKTEVTLQDLQVLVVAKIAEVNQLAGVGLLILSDELCVFNGETSLIGEVDRKLLLMSLADLREKVNRYAILGAQ